MSQQGDPKDVGAASPLWQREAAQLLRHRSQLRVSGTGAAGLQLQHLRDELGGHQGKRDLLGVHCTLHHTWINLVLLLFLPQCHISTTQEPENACPLLPLPGTNPKDGVLLPSLHSSKSFCGFNFSLTDACEVWKRACSLGPSPDKMAGKGESIWSSACRSRRLRKGSSSLILGGYFWTLSALTSHGYKCTFLPGLGQLLSDWRPCSAPISVSQRAMPCSRSLSRQCLAADQLPVAAKGTIRLLVSSGWADINDAPAAFLVAIPTHNMLCCLSLWGHLCCHTASDLLSCIH